jgi:signal transduction histidine kinase
LQGAKVIQEEKVQERLDAVMERLKISFGKQLGDGDYFSSSCDQFFSAKTKELVFDTEQMIDSVLGAENLLMPYEFGLTTCRSKQFSWFSRPEFKQDIEAACQIKLDNYEFSTPLGQDHLHFYTLFPQRGKLIFREMSLAVGSSILFILLLMGAVAYMLYTIHRQKKLSVMKNDFINNLTHEFKTPIASISLAAKTMSRLGEVNRSSKAMDYLRLINHEGKRLENHVDKVLQMATMDSGSFELDKTDVDVHGILLRVRDSFSVLMEKKAGQMTVDLPVQNPVIQADDMHLFNMIYNIVDNAIKYNNNTPFIQLSTEELPGLLKVNITDNGLGMSREVQKQVFEQFYREKTGNVHDVKGFGLGLAYVKKMMEAHGGKIELESQQGSGTTFSLMFLKRK